ncbi:MAG: hypothetical protein V9F02_02720 [Chitinophagaceae bacterium]
MKLHFDRNQSHRWDSVISITDISEGQSSCSGVLNLFKQMRDAGIDFKTI